VTESQFAILRAASCSIDTPAFPRSEDHHQLVQKGVRYIHQQERIVGGQLGRPSGARFRTYERLSRYVEKVRGMLWDTQELRKTVDEIYRYPLRSTAADSLNRQLRSGISDEDLAVLAVNLHNEDHLCLIGEEETHQEPRIICSLGLRAEPTVGGDDANR
jgi:hypothetical protein